MRWPKYCHNCRKGTALFLDKALQVMGSYDLEEIGATVKQKLNENRI